MTLAKFIHLCALASIAILASSFGPAHVNAASLGSPHHTSRSLAHQHHAAQVLRRRDGKRCRPRNPPANTSKPPAGDKPPTSTPAPAPSSSKPPSPPPSQAPKPPPASSGNSKLGIAFPIVNDEALKNIANAAGAHPLLWYDWAPYIPESVRNNPKFAGASMLWGEKQIAEFQRTVKPGYTQYVLGFNEPNQEGQAMMSPQRGAQIWKQYIEPLKDQGMRLISPACTNAPSGKQWIKDFLAACNGGCHLDAVAIHFYGTDPNQAIKYAQEMHDEFGMNIWITEFACQNFGGGAQCNQDQVWEFFRKIKQFALQTPWLERIMPFSFMYDMNNVNPLNRMLDGNFPNALGREFLS